MKHTLGRFTLQNGAVLPEAVIAYDSWGKLAPDGRNAVLVTHGFTSNHLAAGRDAQKWAPVLKRFMDSLIR